MSFKSLRFALGTRTVFTPARCAARSFSLSPPMGSTRPRRVTSPVMATKRFTGIFAMAEYRAVVMAMPAEGPSFGVAPSGT